MTAQTTSGTVPPQQQHRPDSSATPSTPIENSSQDTPVSPELADVAVARRMVQQGAPVLVVRPAMKDGKWDPTGGQGGTGYLLPRGWQQAIADPAALDAWHPGDGLMAVMGHVVDLVDADPRNGSEGSLEVLRTSDAMPHSYGRATTPSGGTHDYIAPLGVGSRDGVLPGIDVKGGKADGSSRGFAFIAPTRKVNKVTGEIGAYAWEVEPDFTETDGDDTGEALAERIRAARPGGAPAATAGAKPATVAATSAEPITDPEGVARYQRVGVDLVEADLRFLTGLAEGERMVSTPGGPPRKATGEEPGVGWERGISDAFYRAGGLVSMPGSSLTEAEVGRRLAAVAPRGGYIDERWLIEKWRVQFARGSQHPAVLPERRDGGQVIVPTERPSSPAERARARFPILGPTPPPWQVLFEVITEEGEDGKPTKKRGKFLPASTADYLDHEMANGRDGRIYAYRDGFYQCNTDEVLRRVAWALQDDYLPGRHQAVADIMRVRRRPALPDVPDLAYINVANGMVKVDSGELLPHDPSYLSAVQLSTPYEPGATCPRFDAWLAQVLPEDTVEMFWEVLGYLLLHGNPLQVAVLLHGSGGNGKGTLLRVLHHLLGRHNVSAVTLAEITEGKFEVAGMYGKQANIAGDIDPRYLKNTAKFKAITGGDVINAQHKNAKPFEFTCWAVPIFSANELWRSADVSRGYFRRWVPIPFPNSVVDSDEPFDEAALYAEAPGILAKALPALGALLRRGRFNLSPSSRALLTAFEEQADSVLSWMGEDDWLSTHEPTATTSWSPRTKLHGRYRTWCIDSGHVALSSTKFYARLTALGYQEGGRAGTRGFYGLALLEGLAR